MVLQDGNNIAGWGSVTGGNNVTRKRRYYKMEKMETMLQEGESISRRNSVTKGEKCYKVKTMLQEVGCVVRGKQGGKDGGWRGLGMGGATRDEQCCS